MVPHFWPQMTCILRTNISGDKKPLSQTGTQIMKRVEGFGRCLSLLQKQEPPFLLPREKDTVSSIFLQGHMASHAFFLLPVHLSSLRVHLPQLLFPTCAGILMTSPHDDSLSRSWRQLPLLGTELPASLTSPWFRFWISRRKNHSYTRPPSGSRFHSDTPKWSSHLWPQGVRLYKRIQAEEPTSVWKKVSEPPKRSIIYINSDPLD